MLVSSICIPSLYELAPAASCTHGQVETLVFDLLVDVDVEKRTRAGVDLHIMVIFDRVLCLMMQLDISPSASRLQRANSLQGHGYLGWEPAESSITPIMMMDYHG